MQSSPKACLKISLEICPAAWHLAQRPVTLNVTRPSISSRLVGRVTRPRFLEGGVFDFSRSSCSTLCYRDFPPFRSASSFLELLSFNLLTCNLQMRLLHPGRLSRDISTSYGPIRMIPTNELTDRVLLWYSYLCLPIKIPVHRPPSVLSERFRLGPNPPLRPPPISLPAPSACPDSAGALNFSGSLSGR